MNTKDFNQELKQLFNIAKDSLLTLQHKGHDLKYIAFGYYNTITGTLLHGSTCTNWNKALIQHDYVNEYNLCKVIKRKFEARAVSVWEDISYPYFKANSSVNEDLPDIIGGFYLPEGYMLVCTKQKPSLVNKELYQALKEESVILHKLLKNKNMVKFKNTLIHLSECNLSMLKANHREDTIEDNSRDLPALILDNIELSSRELSIVQDICNSIREDSKIVYSASSTSTNLTTKLKNKGWTTIESFCKYLIKKNIM